MDRTKFLLQKYNIEPKKSFGQNFLINDSIVVKIINELSIDTFDEIFEIGPGLGALSFQLINFNGTINLIDSDKEMCLILKDLFNTNKNYSIFQQDFLKFDLDSYSKSENRLIIGNLPYNITSKLIEHILKFKFKRIGIMVQKEVAAKLNYCIGAKSNTALGCFLNLNCNIKSSIDLDATDFYPSPSVQSTFLIFDRHSYTDPTIYDFIKVIFHEPNKTILNNLKNTIYFPCLNSIERNELLNLRARQLSLEQVLFLFGLIKKSF